MPVIIAGMHRSGTSMISRLLNLCGLDLGPEDQLMPPSEANAEGYWESLSFVHVNDNILGLLGATWELPPPIMPGWETSPLLDAYHEMARDLPASMRLVEPWGWKDPRNSLTLPFWRSLWPDSKVVICVRNPLEVANSLLDRDRFAVGDALKLWLEHYRCLLDSISPDRALVTHYDAFFLDPLAELTRLVEFLGLPAEPATIEMACESVSRGMRHRCLGIGELRRAYVGDEVEACYRRLCDLGGPTLASCLAESASLRKDEANLVRLALEQEQRIGQLETKLRTAEFRGDEFRRLAEEAAYQAMAHELRLSARRHRYADRVANALLKLSKPLRTSAAN